MNRFFTLSLIFPILLNGCAYFIDRSVQPLTLKTIGAENAECIVDINNLKYRMQPPQTINVGKSFEPMHITCHAPNNRYQAITIPSLIETSTYLNVANGIIPGASWDILSRAAFSYPDVVVVDFSTVKSTPNSLPDHNASDIIQPEDYNLEEFSPAVPRLNSDRNKQNTPITPRKRTPSYQAPTSTYIETGIDSSGKGGENAPATY